jgi:hypothetical protein
MKKTEQARWRNRKTNIWGTSAPIVSDMKFIIGAGLGWQVECRLPTYIWRVVQPVFLNSALDRFGYQGIELPLR